MNERLAAARSTFHHGPDGKWDSFGHPADCEEWVGDALAIIADAGYRLVPAAATGIENEARWLQEANLSAAWAALRNDMMHPSDWDRAELFRVGQRNIEHEYARLSAADSGGGEGA